MASATPPVVVAASGNGPQLGRTRSTFNGNPKKCRGWSKQFKSIMILAGNGAVYGVGVEPSDEVNERVYHEIVASRDTVSADLIEFEDGKADGKKALEVLQDRYLGNKQEIVQCLMQTLFLLKMTEEETALQYIGHIETLKTTLSNHKVEFPAYTFSILALNGLTPKYELFYAIMKVKSPFPDWDVFRTVRK